MLHLIIVLLDFWTLQTPITPLPPFLPDVALLKDNAHFDPFLPDTAPAERHPVKRRKTTPSPHFDPGLVLLNCAALGDVEGVKRLLDHGVNPNVNNVDRITPIHQVFYLLICC